MTVKKKIPSAQASVHSHAQSGAQANKEPASLPTSTARPPASLPFLMLTTLFTGAGVIMLEVLGARIAGPIFGVSLYIWTALIAVTLVSLSLGYWLGGRAADRWPRPDVLYGLIAAAGLLIALIPAFDNAVLVGCYQAFSGSWRVRLGVLSAAFILFGPPLTILGMVSPFVLRLALADLRRAGRTAGTLYSISTVGSVAGTIAAGFFLIPEAGVKATFWASTLVILAPAVVWFALGRRLGWLALGALALLCAGALQGAEARPRMSSGDRLVVSREGLYGQIKVLDREYKEGTMRLLLLDGTAQTELWLNSERQAAGFAQIIERFLAQHPPRGKRGLLVGLGGGALLRPLLARGFAVDVVELDPAVADVAVNYFGCDPKTFRLIEADGRAYIRAADRKYDAIVLDVFTGGSQPFHLFSLESFQQLRRILAPGGVVALNTIGYARGLNIPMSASLFRTAAQVFPHQRAFVDDTDMKTEALTNIVMAFSDAPFAETPAGIAETDLKFLEERQFSFEMGAGQIITDEMNPVDRWCARVNEDWRQIIFNDLGPAVLSY